ncbi:MAG: hypothetical protein CMP59_10160 [Flavobacteriales bacterium]|nr:hypothetical protein [Flavobacteriales bacterium]
MKKLCYILLLLPAFLNAQGDTTSIDTKVEAVTVFFSGAEVHREGKINLSKGKHTIKIEDLPSNLLSQTLQVEGMNGVSILSVKQEKSSGNSEEEELAYELIEDQIDSLNTISRKLRNEIYALRVEEKLLMGNSQFGGAEKGAEIDELKQASAFYRTRLLNIHNEIIDLHIKIKKNNDAIADKYEELNKRFANKNKLYSTVLISLECESPTNTALQLSYYIPTAGWIPTYDFRVREITDPLKIIYNANVFQSSGEDWDKVSLTLSSNNPSISSAIPEMQKWLVNRNQPFVSDYPDFSQNENLAKDGVSSLKGKIRDYETGEPVPFANVSLMKNGEQYLGATTDFDGFYTLKPIEPGNYDLRVSYIGYQTIQVADLLIPAARIVNQDVIISAGIALSEVEVTEYSSPLFEKDQTTMEETVTREEIQRMAVRSATDIAGTAGNGVFSRDYGHTDINYRGARDGNDVTFIDGIQVTGSTQLPKSAIEEVSVQSRGKSAAYGDSDYYGDYSSGSSNRYISSRSDAEGPRSSMRQMVSFEKNDNALSLEYEIKVPYTIPSDGKDYNIKIKEESMKVDYEYHVLPRFEKEAFLMLNLTNWEELDLLSGEASIYYRGTYTGETYINSQATEDTLSISLGRDKQIFVSRDENKELDNQIIFSNNIKETVAWEIVVKNNKQFPIRVIVKDQYPLSNRKNIECELLEAQDAVVDEKKGFLEWTFDLDAGAKKDVGFSYEVKYPRYGNYIVR